MRLVTKGFLLLCSLLLALALPVSAQQMDSEPVVGFHGNVEGDPNLVGKQGQGSSATSAITVVYDNTASAANFGFSSTDLAAIWGDRLLLTGTGLVSSHVFSIFNTGTSAGNLLTAQVAVDFFDFASATYLGGYTTGVNFGAGLTPGFYSLVTVPGLDGLGITIPNPDILVLQTLLGTTGPANRLGIASLDPPTVGSSPTTMYIQAATVNAGTPGFYSIGNPPLPANPGYQLTLADTPTSTTSRTWGQIKKLYR
jgi:hypothetical protein